MSNRPELLEHTDQQIDGTVAYADPMVVRGLLYQLTRDESLFEIKTKLSNVGLVDVHTLAERGDAAGLRAKAAAYLKRHRDAGAVAPRLDRSLIPASLGLTAGREIPGDELEMWLETTGLDPWGRTFAWKERPPAEQIENFQVAVIGAGMGGLAAALTLKRAGIPFFVIERGSEVGGTWFANRYPGARVDSPSRIYAHIFGTEYGFRHAFAPQAENLDYFRWVADNFDLRRHVLFNTEVVSLAWDDAEAMWEINATGPEGPLAWRVNAVITSVGFLSRPSIPNIPGIESFQGRAFHTAEWPDEIDLTDKRVALVGTGASGYQLAPELAKMAGHLRIFQRTPSWCFDVRGYLGELPPEALWLERCFPYYRNFNRFRQSWIIGPEPQAQSFRIDPGFVDDFARSARNKEMRDKRVAFIRAKLADRPDIAEKMIPDLPPLAARWVLMDPADSIYDALLRDNVELVTDGIDRINPGGVTGADGREHPADVIVFATGFKANEYLWPMEVRGRNGLRPQNLWKEDGPRAYLGAMLPGFPNFFMVYGPNSNSMGGLGVTDFEEMVVRFSVDCIAGLISRQKRSLTVSEAAYRTYNKELDVFESRMLYTDPRAKSYYKNKFGRSSVNNAIDVRKMWRWLREPSVAVPPAVAEGAPVKPWFGYDLQAE